MLIIIIIVTIITSVNPTVTVRKLTDYVYLEEIGKAAMAKGTMQVATCTSEEEMQRNLLAIMNVTNWFKEMCVAESLENCEAMIKQMNQTGLEIEKLINTTRTYPEIPRQKRSLLRSFLGWFSDTDEEIFQDLDDLQDTQHKLNNNQHVLIKTTRAMKTDMATLQSNMKRMNTTLAQMKELSFDKKMEKKFSLLMEYTLSMNFLKDIKSRYLELLAPQVDLVLLEKAERIQGGLKISTKFTKESGWDNSEFCTTLEHVIYHKEQFKLLKIYQLAQKINGTWKTARMNEQLVAVAESNYFTLTQIKFMECNKESRTFYVCGVDKLLDAAKNPSCILQRMHHYKGDGACKYVNLTTNKTILQPLVQANSWIYTAPQETIMEVTCANYSEKITLLESGILKNPEDCITKIEGATLMTTKSRQFKSLGHYNLDPRLIMATNPRKEENITNATENFEILDIGDKLEQIDFEPIVEHHDHHHYTGPTAVGSSTLVIIALVVIWYFKKSKVQVIATPVQQPCSQPLIQTCQPDGNSTRIQMTQEIHPPHPPKPPQPPKASQPMTSPKPSQPMTAKTLPNDQISFNRLPFGSKFYEQKTCESHQDV